MIPAWPGPEPQWRNALPPRPDHDEDAEKAHKRRASSHRANLFVDHKGRQGHQPQSAGEAKALASAKGIFWKA